MSDEKLISGMSFPEMLEVARPEINWKVTLRESGRTIYRQVNKSFFEEITPDMCRMETRDLFPLSTPSTTSSLVTALLEDRERLFDDSLFRDSRKAAIGFKNGVFDVQTGKVRKYHTSDFILQPLPHVIPYEIDPKTEKWFIAILNSWVGQGVGEWFCNVLGYMLFVYPNSENLWLNLFGAGQNGKSVCLELLERILGDEKVIGCDLKNINRFSGDAYQNKWLVIGRDSSSAVSDNAVSFIKTYTGDAKLLVEKKGGASFDVWNPGKLIVSTNSLIMSKDRSFAWYRRLFPIPFPNEFPRDEKFKDSLFQRIPEITRILLHRAYLYRQTETTLFKSIPTDVEELRKETRKLNDRITAFWEEYFCDDGQLLPDKLLNAHGKTMNEIYQLYTQWHESEFGETALEPSLKVFGGPYGALLQSPAGKYFTYRRSNTGRRVELRQEYYDEAMAQMETSGEPVQETVF